MEKTTLVAPDISCEHCQHAIEGALGELSGVNTRQGGYSDENCQSHLRSAKGHACEDRGST